MSQTIAPIEICLTDSVLGKQARLRDKLRTQLDQFVIGQQEAKTALIDTVLNGLFNVSREQGALGAVFLGGPTGVGKTELVRSIARVLLGNPEAFTKIACEMMPHPADIARLTGASAGYIGYGDAPEMADTHIHRGYKNAKEQNKLHPILVGNGYDAENFSIILVDEVEKAHPDIPNTFLNAIQSGYIDLASGKETSKSRVRGQGGIDYSKRTDLSNTLFVFTSNIGEHKISESRRQQIGFVRGGGIDHNGDNSLFHQEFKKRFAPEFRGRMDAVVRCHALSDEHVRQAFELHIERMNIILADKRYEASIRVATTRAYVDHVLFEKKGEDSGARAIAPVIKKIGAEVGLALRSGRIPEGANGIIQFDIRNNAPDIRFLTMKNTEISDIPPNPQTISVAETIRDIVEGKIEQHGDNVRKTVQAYMDIINGYDTGFEEMHMIYKKRLLVYGFSQRDVERLQEMAYVFLYQNMEQPDHYEIIIRDECMFAPIGFRMIEKFMRNACRNQFELGRIYTHITTLLKRPMTQDEYTVIMQHLHRMIQQKPIK